MSAMHIRSDKRTNRFHDGAEVRKKKPPLKKTISASVNDPEELVSEADHATADEPCPCCGKHSTAPADEKAAPASLQDTLGMAGLPRTGSVEYYE